MGKHTKGGDRTYGDGKGEGYKNISPKHQWKKGDPSPNPGGRPRRATPEGLEAMLAELDACLDNPVTANGPNGPTKVTPGKAAMQRLSIDAMNDSETALKLFKLRFDVALAMARLPQREEKKDEENWKEEDQDLLRMNNERIARQLASRTTAEQTDDGSDDDE